MKKFLFLIALACSLGTVTAQQAKSIHDPDARERKLNGSFHAVEVSDGIELFLSAGSSEQLAVSMSDFSYDDKLKTEVEDGVLKIYYKNENYKIPRGKKLGMKAYVSYKNIDRLQATSGSWVRFSDGLKTASLSVKLTSGAHMEGRLDVDDLSVVQNSGSRAEITGNAQKTTLDLSSGAKFSSPDFSTKTCNAEASSGSAIDISIDQELLAKATSGAKIRYKGQAVIRDIKVNSGGSVKKV